MVKWGGYPGGGVCLGANQRRPFSNLSRGIRHASAVQILLEVLSGVWRKYTHNYMSYIHIWRRGRDSNPR